MAKVGKIGGNGLQFNVCKCASTRISAGESRLGKLTQNGQNLLCLGESLLNKTVSSRVRIPPKMPFGRTTIAEYRSIGKLIYQLYMRLNIFKQILPGSEDTKLKFFTNENFKFIFMQVSGMRQRFYENHLLINFQLKGR